MSKGAWFHEEHLSKQFVSKLGLQFLYNQNRNCKYCSNKMLSKPIADLWDHSPEDYIELHHSSLDFEWMMREQGVPLKHLELEDGDPGGDIFCSAYFCNVCGWWVLEKRVQCCAKEWQIWELGMACAGSLRNLDLTDISIPITEVRKYLSAKYCDRFYINPRRFEEVVASIFKDIGYDTQITAFTNDGGIDIIMNGPNNDTIGVQVKRYKNSIEVEQIRSFLGALVVNEILKGVFITTSYFQKGANKLAENLTTKYASIELIDSKKLFEVLKLAQTKKLNENYPLDIIHDSPELDVVYNIHLKSL